MKSKVGTVELNYQIDGEPDLPWLVFSNSVATDLSLWDIQVQALKSRFRILRYDQRGHGKSDAPSGEYSIDLAADDLRNLMNSLDIREANLVGISMGGMTVLTLAKRHPQLVDKLVVCDCGPAASPASANQWLQRIEAVKEKGMESIIDETLGRWFTKETLDSKSSIVEAVADMIRNTPNDGFIGSAHALATFDLRPGLEDIRVPTLFIAGEHDAVIEGTRSLSKAVPDSKFIAVAKAGHLCNLENPEGFLSALTDLL